MKQWWRARTGLICLALVVSACAGASEASTTTSSTTTTVTTTIPPAPTTTVDDGPCPSPFCVTYHIRPEATWSDGVPVTAEDFLTTLDVFSDPLNPPSVVKGYDLIEGFEVLDPKTVMFAFSEVYGPWRTLFDVVLPAHIEDPTDLSVTAGAFRFHERIEDDRIVLRRNNNYWAASDPASGQPAGNVGQVEFVFVESVRDRLQGLEDGEIDVIDPVALDWVVDDLAEMEGVISLVTPGPFWEHIDFNHDDPLLSQKWVREAIAMSIDRDAIAAETLRTVVANAALLDNSVWMTQSGDYEAHYPVQFDPEAAEQILVDRFCVKGDDGIYDCQGRRMSFVWASTVGDESREVAAEMARESLESIGVELIIDLRTPSDLFSSDVFFAGPGVWQIINFSWKSDADPHLGNSIYFCSGSAPSGFGGLNVNRYCNDDVEALVRSTDSIPDAEDRADTYNAADRLYLEDLAIIPLYQKPVLLAWNAEIRGIQPNMSRATDMWNLASWAGPEQIVIALETEPLALNPVATWNDDTAMVMRSLVSGAFTITPSLEFIPVLIESAETLVSGS